ncbi:MAG TPA: DUF1801 domain-containing protein [Longimicrobiaceae bacterium]|nr:DUF1801 domain-containing protein [Longimicrobiaceae bacterium]
MAEPTVDDLLNTYSPEVRDLALRTCELIRRILPGASEKVHLGWKSIQFGTGPGMKQTVFGVMPLRERVNIFLAGADLPDPTGLLEGTGKAGRHVKVTRPEILDDPALYALLRAAVEAHGTPKEERQAKAGPPVEGYRAYASKTVNVPVETLFAAWTDESLRDRWLGAGKLTVRGATPGKSLRARWEDDTPLDVRFTARGEGKSDVNVDHRKIGSPEAAEHLKAVWKESLERLKQVLENTV